VNYGRRDGDLSERKRRRTLVAKENDRISGTLAKLRDHYTCQVCHKVVLGRNADACHIIPRTHMATRWLTQNQFCGCYRCHKFFWHDHPIKSGEWAKKNFGEKLLAWLDSKDVIVHVTDEYVNTWNRALKAEYLRVTGVAWKS
jgi:5-methylcytosine-specific restriction endonuclease McrA